MLPLMFNSTSFRLGSPYCDAINNLNIFGVERVGGEREGINFSVINFLFSCNPKQHLKIHFLIIALLKVSITILFIFSLDSRGLNRFWTNAWYENVKPVRDYKTWNPISTLTHKHSRFGRCVIATSTMERKGSLCSYLSIYFPSK